MSQNHPLISHSTREVIDSQVTSALDWRKGPTPDEIVELLDRRAAMARFHLTQYQLYMAVRRRELQPVQVGGKGRVYYLETQLRELSERVVQPWVRRVA